MSSERDYIYTYLNKIDAAVLRCESLQEEVEAVKGKLEAIRAEVQSYVTTEVEGSVNALQRENDRYKHEVEMLTKRLQAAKEIIRKANTR